MNVTKFADAIGEMKALREHDMMRKKNEERERAQKEHTHNHRLTRIKNTDFDELSINKITAIYAIIDDWL